MNDPTSACALTQQKSVSRRRRVGLRTYRCARTGSDTVDLQPEERQVINRALAILERKLLREAEIMNAPESLRQWLHLHYGLLDREVFGLLLLNTQLRLIAHEQLFFGTLAETAVYPREVARCAFHYNASSVIAVHCHPSGVAEPSRADELLTRRLKEALALIDVRLLDHFIVAGNHAISFAERGLM